LYISAAFADPSKTIVGNAQATPSLSTLVKVLTSPGYAPLLQTLNSPGTFTVFAPNDNAFAAAQIDPTNVDLVTQVLLYHVLPAVVRSTDLTTLQFPNTSLTDRRYALLGGKAQVLAVSKDSNGVSINFGIPGVANLTAHVLTADVIASNGVVHIIDRVLFFPETTSRTAQAAGLTELVAALQKAGIVNTVDGTDSLTIFAPSNAAMIAAGWSRLDIPTLQSVLQYHVVPSVAYSTDLKNGQQIKTLQGKNVAVRINGQSVQINDANVAVPNVLIRNGVVHVIDKVLMPPQSGKGKNGKAKGKNGKGNMMGGSMMGGPMMGGSMMGSPMMGNSMGNSMMGRN
jgi:uncharacterized surface protein with fasciclin (FAS1) repeats